MLENFKYIKNISGNEATMLLYSQIGDSIDANGNYKTGVNGSSFAHELQYLATQVDVINVRINSIGGNVLDGYSIVSAILNCSKIVNTYIDGVAASTAGWIAVAGKKCSMMDYGTFMLHNPNGGEDKKVTTLVKDTIVTILSNRTAKTAAEIDTMMNVETWLSAKDCLDNGIIDGIISSGKKIKVPKNAALLDMELMYNKFIQPTNNMTKINALLKISNNADESEQASAIESLNKQITDKEAELNTLKGRVKELEDANTAREATEKTELTNKATALAEKMVKAGIITEDEKAATILNASKSAASFEFVNNLTSKLGSGKNSQKPFDIRNVKPENEADRSAWDYGKWQKEDMMGLKNMLETDSDKYKELFKNRKK